jgi:hypothetical protein
MNKILNFIFNLQYIYLAIPILLFLIYFPGIIIAFNRLGITQETIEFLFLFLCSLSVYFLTYFFFKTINYYRLIVNNGISLEVFSLIVISLYAFFVFYAAVTAPKIPLFEAIMGASSTDIANYREMFFKARTGFDSILVYINALFTVSILPFLVALLYLNKAKYRHIFLVFFILTLLLSMEKSLIARAILPLLVLVVNGVIIEKYISVNIILGVLIIGLIFITTLTLGRLSSDNVAIVQEVIDIDPITAKYFILSNPDSVIQFLLNRIFWIPYITAIDWLSYFNEILHRDYVYGASSSLISGIFGLERMNLERLVFEYEWGQNESGTGSSNTVYFVDIFLNFGWIGVIFSNMLIALVVNFFEFCDNKAANATFFVYAYFIVTSSLIAVLFSSGLLLLMFLMLTLKTNYSQNLR